MATVVPAIGPEETPEVRGSHARGLSRWRLVVQWIFADVRAFPAMLALLAAIASAFVARTTLRRRGDGDNPPIRAEIEVHRSRAPGAARKTSIP